MLVSGTAPIWPDGSCDPDPEVQAKRCLEIILEALAEADATAEHVVRTRMFVTDAAYAERSDALTPPSSARSGPRRRWWSCAGLLDPRWKVEIEAEAIVG